MIKLFKYRNLKSIEFKIAFTIMLMWSILSFIFTIQRNNIYEGFDYDYKYSFCWCAAAPYGLLFSTVLVMCVILVATATVLNDKKDYVFSVIMSRAEFLEYLWFKLLSIISIVLRVVAIPLMVNYSLCYFFLPHNEYSPYWADRIYMEGFILGRDMNYNAINPVLPNIKLFLQSPDLYVITELLLIVFFSLVLAVFAALIAFFFKVSRTVMIAIPVIIIQLFSRYSNTLLDNAIADRGHIYVNYTLDAYFDPIGHTVSGINYQGFFIMLALMIVGSLILIMGIIRKKEKYVLM